MTNRPPHQPPTTPPDEDDARTIILGGEGYGTARPTEPAETTQRTQAGLPPDIASAPPPPSPSAPPAPQMLMPGTIINNLYRVEAPLDQGGMGRVYRGVETAVKAPVAIKVIQPEMADAQMIVDMFVREAGILQELHHDAIVPYRAYVPPSRELNLHCLIMGFIEGTKLKDKVETDGPLTADEICRLFIRLADGLGRAHASGVVHRDLSPDNVMLRGNDIDRAVLIDFGISRSSRGDVTGFGFAGKLKYVAPEQLGAYGGAVDSFTDVYSLGLLMIFAAAGKPAEMGRNEAEAVLAREGWPSMVGVPLEFQTLLHEMLQPDPSLRMRDMAQVKSALQAIAGGSQPGWTSPPGTMPPVTDVSVPGLQASPMSATAPRRTTPPGSTDVGSLYSSDGGAEPESKASPGGGLKTLLFAAVVLAAIGGGAAVFWPSLQPLLGGNDTASTGTVSADGVQRIAGSREAFLAETVPQDGCAYATRRGHGNNSGTVEGFGGPGITFDALRTAWTDRFDSAPSLTERRINASQCAVLDLARAVQGTAAPAIEIALDVDTAPVSEGVVGTIHGGNGRVSWLALVAANGLVFSLQERLNNPIGNEQSFGFSFGRAPAGVYVVLAISSEKALARTGAMQDGTRADDVLPLIGRELAKDPQGAVSIAYLELTR